MEAERRKVWAFVLYKESLPRNWIDLLGQTLVQIAVSPLHDRDLWIESDEEKNEHHKAGTLKKPHYHVVMYFESLKSCNQVLSLISAFNVSYVMPIESPKAYNRYLCHLDQPEKAQYPTDEILRINGAICDISKPIPTARQQEEIRRDICAFVRESGIANYADLITYADKEELTEWAFHLTSHTVFWRGYLKDVRYSENL